MTAYRDPDLLAENERLRGENERLVEALAFSRSAKPVQPKETIAERASRVSFSWGGAVVGIGVGLVLAEVLGLSGYGPWMLLGLLGPPTGFSLAWIGVSFNRWILKP